MLDRYKWLHPDCIPPSIPFGEGPLHDPLLDPNGISFPSDGRPPVLSLCKTCHSYLKKKKMPTLSLVNQTLLGSLPGTLKDLTVIEDDEEAMNECSPDLPLDR
jgi:hypothetical protein